MPLIACVLSLCSPQGFAAYANICTVCLFVVVWRFKSCKRFPCEHNAQVWFRLHKPHLLRTYAVGVGVSERRWLVRFKNRMSVAVVQEEEAQQTIFGTLSPARPQPRVDLSFNRSDFNLPIDKLLCIAGVRRRLESATLRMKYGRSRKQVD